MGAIIRKKKNEFTYVISGKGNRSKIKYLLLQNHKYQANCKFYFLPTLINDGMNDIVFLVSLINVIFKGYIFQKKL